jgi:phosphatidate cytidylyltransferase
LSELTKRILFGMPAAAIFLWITWLGGNAFQTMIFAIGLLTVWEVHRIMQHSGAADFFPVSLLFALVIWRGDMFSDWLLMAIVSLVLLLTVIAIIGKDKDISRRWLSTLFTGVYAPIGYLMVIQIRELGIGMEGFWLTLSLFLMIWGNDVFAYFGGKKFGKRPLAPKTSPKKTWEGFWFGFMGASAGFLIAWSISDQFPLPIWVIFGAVAIVSTMGPLGDILASKLKRIANVKDSSALLPGHGGFFDRFDSLILSAPFIYFLYFLLV